MPKTAERPTPVRGRENEVSQEDIEKAAYYHWLNRGCPNDDSLTDWVEAERELSAEGHWVSKQN